MKTLYKNLIQCGIIPVLGGKMALKFYNFEKNKTNINWNAYTLIITVIAVVSTVLAIVGFSKSAVNASYKDNSIKILKQYCVSASNDALTYANKLSSSLDADTRINLASVKQSIATIDKLNEMSYQLSNKTNRIIGIDAITLILDDIAKFEDVLKAGKKSTDEVRSLLLNHLLALQYVLSK